MKVYTKQYMIDTFGCSENDYNATISIISNDDECCYCCDIDDINNLYLFGAKFEVYNGTDIVSVDTVIDKLQLNDDESMTLKNIILCNGNIDHIKSICISTHTLFNDEYISVQSYIKSHIIDIKNSLNNYNIVACDTDIIGIVTVLITDNNNINNKYRIGIRDDMVVCVQYIDNDDIITDIISILINDDIPHIILNSMIDFINMSINYYMNVIKFDNE